MSLVSLRIRNPRLGPGRGIKIKLVPAGCKRRPHIEMIFLGAGQAVTSVIGPSAKDAVDLRSPGPGLDNIIFQNLIFQNTEGINRKLNYEHS